MKNFNWLALGFLAPALIVITVFFLAPVILTGIFSFTSMSTSTGVTGGEYLLNQSGLRALTDKGLNITTLDQLKNAGYIVDEKGLTALAKKHGAQTAEEMRKLHKNGQFSSRRDMERALKDLKAYKIRSTKDRKAAAELFKHSMLNERFNTETEFRTALAEGNIPTEDHEIIVTQAYTGWVWTTENIKLLFSLPSSLRYAGNTLIYVTLTLMFNVGFGLFLAITTFYLPSKSASTFRAIWFLPRILPPVMYVLLWKWLTWDTGFIATTLSWVGVPPKNWMLDTSVHAWVVVVFINGSFGASLGMILFSSAIKAIPTSILHSSEVDGANRWQQVRYIILPHLRWPILFITSYQTLSLLTSFEHILLSTEGGPGRATEVWSLAAYHVALDNYGGNLQYGLGATFAVMLVIIGIIASLFYLRFFNFNEMVTKPKIEG